MNIEMSKREELSDGELDGVTGGSTFGEFLVYLAKSSVETVRSAIHTMAQDVADVTK